LNKAQFTYLLPFFSSSVCSILVAFPKVDACKKRKEKKKIEMKSLVQIAFEKLETRPVSQKMNSSSH